MFNWLFKVPIMKFAYAGKRFTFVLLFFCWGRLCVNCLKCPDEPTKVTSKMKLFKKFQLKQLTLQTTNKLA